MDVLSFLSFTLHRRARLAVPVHTTPNPGIPMPFRYSDDKHRGTCSGAWERWGTAQNNSTTFDSSNLGCLKAT
ncbi:hypothetical protein D3C85_624940 [compost metagenome]